MAPVRLDPLPAHDRAPIRAAAAIPEFGLRVRRARHDLNNTISQILGFSEMLLEEIHEEGREGLRPELELIHRHARRMMALTNRALKASKIEAGGADLGWLQRQLGKRAARIRSAVELLAGKSRDVVGELFNDNVSRIGAAARQAEEFASRSFGFEPDLVRDKSEPPAAAVSPESDSSGRPAAASAPPQTRRAGSILVVDDLEQNRELLARRLSPLGYTVRVADNGQHALESVASDPVDLILLDILMPGLNGIEVLQRLKGDPLTQHIPVVMLSSDDQIDTVVRCIKLGADDFLPKPFNSTLLTARIESSLSKKRLRDQETAFLKRLQAEQETSERLLLNILPRPIAERLKRGEKTIADSFAEVTVLFSDFVDFTKACAGIAPKELVGCLNEVFSAFDRLCEQYGLEKIKMIGDGYMAVGGVPTPRTNHAQAAADLALAMQHEAARFANAQGEPFRMRIGLNTGPVVAGVIGTRKFAYDLWGDTVNMAKRMESCAPPGGILVMAPTYERLRDTYSFKPGRVMRVKGTGEVLTYLLVGRSQSAGDAGPCT